MRLDNLEHTKNKWFCKALVRFWLCSFTWCIRVATASIFWPWRMVNNEVFRRVTCDSDRSCDVAIERLLWPFLECLYISDSYRICRWTYFEQECIPVGCVPSAAVGGGDCLPGRGVCPNGLSARGVSATHPLPPWTEWQTPVKTLPCRNYVEDGNYVGDDRTEQVAKIDEEHSVPVLRSTSHNAKKFVSVSLKTQYYVMWAPESMHNTHTKSHLECENDILSSSGYNY